MIGFFLHYCSINFSSKICLCISNESIDDGFFPFLFIFPASKNGPCNCSISNICLCNTNKSIEFIFPSPFKSPYINILY